MNRPSLTGQAVSGFFSKLSLRTASRLMPPSFIFSFMGVWNDFMWPLLVTNSETMRTIQVGIAYFKDGYSTQYGPIMAASFVASVPILVVFLAANRSFVAGITMTGIKG